MKTAYRFKCASCEEGYRFECVSCGASYRIAKNNTIPSLDELHVCRECDYDCRIRDKGQEN